MQTKRRVWKHFQRYNVVSFVVSRCLAAALGLPMISATQLADWSSPSPAQAASASASTVCQQVNPIRYYVGSRNRSGARAWRWRWKQGRACHRAVYVYHSYRAMVPFTRLRHSARHVVVAVTRHSSPPAEQTLGSQFAERVVHAVHAMTAANMFPYGQCTWWANQRYYQLHGVFVPWGMNANAAQWVARAHDAGWQVSGDPTVGSIVVMQPGVQGASYGYGHVAVVERVLSDGAVIASSMNWGSNPWAVTRHQLHPGPGIAFVRQM